MSVQLGSLGLTDRSGSARVPRDDAVNTLAVQRYIQYPSAVGANSVLADPTNTGRFVPTVLAPAPGSTFTLEASTSTTGPPTSGSATVSDGDTVRVVAGTGSVTKAAVTSSGADRYLTLTTPNLVLTPTAAGRVLTDTGSGSFAPVALPTPNGFTLQASTSPSGAPTGGSTLVSDGGTMRVVASSTSVVQVAASTSGATDLLTLTTPNLALASSAPGYVLTDPSGTGVFSPQSLPAPDMRGVVVAYDTRVADGSPNTYNSGDSMNFSPEIKTFPFNFGQFKYYDIVPGTVWAYQNNSGRDQDVRLSVTLYVLSAHTTLDMQTVFYDSGGSPYASYNMGQYTNTTNSEWFSFSTHRLSTVPDKESVGVVVRADSPVDIKSGLCNMGLELVYTTG